MREVYEKHSIKADRIWNIDETEVKNVHKPEKIIALKGTKQIAERGTTVPVCGGINAAGNHIPPYFIFPRVNWQPRMLNGAPPGSDGTASVSGWMTGPLFLKFMHHFVRFCNPRDDEKVLLILDNHESHVSLDAVNFARENNIVMLTIPPHTNYFLLMYA